MKEETSFDNLVELAYQQPENTSVFKFLDPDTKKKIIITISIGEQAEKFQHIIEHYTEEKVED